MFASPVRELGSGLFLSNFKLTCKTATPSALVTAKYSDLTLLCIDNQYLFLQYHAAIFISASCSLTNQPVHLPSQIHIESNFSVNLYPVFYLKTFRKK